MPLLVLLMGLEMGVSFFGPLLPQVQQEFRISAGTVALALSVYHGIRLLFNVPIGRLVARSSLPVMLAGGGALFAAGAVIVALAASFSVLLAGRALMGIGSATFFITSQFWISKVATRETKAQLFSYNQIANLTGSAVGPALGGAVAGLFSWRYSLLLAALAGIVALVGGRRLADPTAGRAGDVPQVAEKTAIRLPLTAVLGPGMIMLALFFFHGGMLATLIPLFAAREVHLGPAAIGGIMLLGTLWRFGAAVAGGRLAAHFGIRRVVLTGLVVLAASVLGFLPVDSPLGLIVAVSITSWANVGGSLVVALVTDVVHEAHWGVALGINRTIADVGALIAPLLVGFMIDHHGFTAAILVVAGVLFAVAVAASMLIPSRSLDAATI
ncbi:MAG: MFS transporter [Armatimonadota bacterium]